MIFFYCQLWTYLFWVVTHSELLWLFICPNKVNVGPEKLILLTVIAVLLHYTDDDDDDNDENDDERINKHDVGLH